MKFSILTALVSFSAVSAFAPQSSQKASTVSLNAEAEQSRKAFISVAGAALFGASLPGVAGAMDQVNIKTPTERWEYGAPKKEIVKDRMALYTNARTQMNSNFAPIKRTTLERKSPVTRLDLNAPNFEGYKRTYPGLYKTVPSKAVASAPPAPEPAPAEAAAEPAAEAAAEAPKAE